MTVTLKDVEKRRRIRRHTAGRTREYSEAAQSAGDVFLALLAQSAPRIAAGMLRPMTPDDIAAAIEAARP